MTGFDSKRRIALDRLDDDDIQIYAQPEGKIMTEEEARTLEAMKYAASMGHGRMVREMKIAPFTIKEALAQPEQEPVAWITPDGEGFRIRFSPPTNDVPLGWDALYTTPPKRQWVGLTDEEIAYAYTLEKKFAMQYVDAKLKEKNFD